jgi:glycopeptide antibiotics resistance protein
VIQGEIVWLGWPVVVGIALFRQLRHGARWPQVLGAVILCTYAAWICSVAFFPLPLSGGPTSAHPNELIGGVSVNLAPVVGILRALPGLGAWQIVREFGGNLLLFIPFTLGGPLLWPRLRTWWWPLLAGLGGSVLIEMIQLTISGLVGYPYRQADIDDVLLNTAGAFLGYGLFALMKRVAPAGRIVTLADRLEERRRPPAV